jgi:NSS family neurotransmitter:Na+ symporter
VRRIEIFDTLIAVLAGLMIIPVVYIFAVKTGTPVKEAMNAGPGLMFITLPKVFASLGAVGPWVGMAFFLLVVFAAATSAISLYEACVAAVCDVLKINRKAATFFTGSLILFLATFSALGYGAWGGVKVFGMQFLDFFDFVTNSAFMPIVAAVTCIFVGWVIKPKAIIEECEVGSHVMKAKSFYSFMVRYLAPALMIALLVSEVCRALGIGGWSI